MCGGGWEKKCGLRTIQWLEKDGDGGVEQGVCGFGKCGDISLRIGEKRFLDPNAGSKEYAERSTFDVGQLEGWEWLY